MWKIAKSGYVQMIKDSHKFPHRRKYNYKIQCRNTAKKKTPEQYQEGINCTCTGKIYTYTNGTECHSLMHIDSKQYVRKVRYEY